MNKIIATIVGLLVLATPVLANGDVSAATINTYFTNDGWVSGFDEMTMINPLYDNPWHPELITGYSEMINEEIYAYGFEPHTLTVVKQGEYTYHHDMDYVSLNEDKWIWYDGDPHCCGELFIGKDVAWGQGENGFGAGDVYRYAEFGEDPLFIDETHAGGIGTGAFMDRIETNKDTFVYQSVGLDQFATCDFEPPVFEPLDPPDCEWCD